MPLSGTAPVLGCGKVAELAWVGSAREADASLKMLKGSKATNRKINAEQEDQR